MNEDLNGGMNGCDARAVREFWRDPRADMQTLNEALSRKTVPEVKALAALLPTPAPGSTKAALVAGVEAGQAGPMLPAMLAMLDLAMLLRVADQGKPQVSDKTALLGHGTLAATQRPPTALPAMPNLRPRHASAAGSAMTGSPLREYIAHI